MSSPVAYRPEAWAYVDQRGMRSGAAVAPSDAGPHVNAGNNANADGAYCDRRTATYVDECGRPCAAPMTPRIRWSPPPSQPGGMTGLYDVNQTATPDMALIIERLLDDLDREREARARAEERTTVTTTTAASSFTTTPPVPGAAPGTAVITQHVQTPIHQQALPPVQQQQLTLPPGAPPSYAPSAFVGAPAAAPSALVGGIGGNTSPSAPTTTSTMAAASAAPSPPGTTSNRTLLLALIPVVIILLLFGAWVVWRLSGIERRLTALTATHASSAGALPLVSPVVSSVTTAPAITPAAPQPSRGMLAVDTNNQYYYARPIVP
ncbi:hypothetical protein pmac_cds_254 [Pandoravirus macleodensis]|uniref:Uncharacterized protein n=1 Tax=Pandoravirus macleodensis TaxID=2107707 RepID=A0A2U7UEX0_9VIRU|nr:hypothetical protein pmac_cds_254 [Pandoravirus macleodensis]AVK76942.1 hypothetical protein pmac_cds_254 [Pandoravirus macleodensis]